MSWILPSALAIAGLGALATVALHFIARSRPVAEPLPTARFIPERAVHARTRSVALTDILLMFVRVAVVAMLGVAVAGPVFASGGRVARIVIADRSRAVADISVTRDSVRAYLRAGDQLIVFDSATSLPRESAPIDSVVPSRARGSLSAALTAATRAGVLAARRVDSVELVLISPFSEEEVDAATPKIRASWPGRIRVVPVRARVDSVVSGRTAVEIRATSNDAVAAGVSLMALHGPPARVVRGRMTADDSAWARGAGNVLVHWPASDADADWPLRASIDAVGGVSTRGATLVARFPRPWVLEGRAIARWADGEPAAVERDVGGGCIRDVAILFDDASDLALHAPFRAVAADLLAPCGGVRVTTALSAAQIGVIGGEGRLAPAERLRDEGAATSRWTPWLLAAAALFLITELAIRRTARSAA